MDVQYIMLHHEDNVIIALEDLEKGTEVVTEVGRVVIQQAVPSSHKIACKAIAKEEKVIKYGVSIGRATQDIAVGEWVHDHNLTSEYIEPQES